MAATSPVRNQPSSVNWARRLGVAVVAAGRPTGPRTCISPTLFAVPGQHPPSSSTIRMSTPGDGAPLLGPDLVALVLGQASMYELGRHTVPSGDISVIPQAWSM